MSVKGSPVTKTQVGLLSEFGPFDEARKIESFSLPIHDENWEETDSHVDGISRLRRNLISLEQLHNKMSFMLNEIESLIVKS